MDKQLLIAWEFCPPNRSSAAWVSNSRVGDGSRWSLLYGTHLSLVSSLHAVATVHEPLFLGLASMRSSSSSDTTKKRLGQNLSKLVQPAARESAAGRSKNGLLVLSTKKTSGTGLLRSSKIDGELTLGSSLDAGAAPVPDAWGVADKPLLATASTEESPRLDSVAAPAPPPVVETESTTASSNWDEYGGRGETTAAEKQLVEIEDQTSVMTRLARERAERRQAEEQAREQAQRERAAQRLQELEEKMAANTPPTPPPQAMRSWDATRSGTRELWEPEQLEDAASSPRTSPMAAATASGYTGPLIHLASYEDRDRGERHAAPRMLFDPKSGSMVAVKGRGDEAGGRKKTTKKTRKDTKSDSPTDSKNGRTKRDKSEEDKKRVNPQRRLPRTCGVLYTRDDKGNCFCADDCDGDLGYGAHSVPGGRTRNPEAYAEYVKQHQQFYDKEGNAYDEHYDMYDGDPYSPRDDENVALYTGFNPDDELAVPEPMEYVRADDKLELVTGVESPSLKPTAKEWAPSQAALAAAAAAAAAQRATDRSVDTSVEEEEDGDDADGPNGLGFDPTMHMDFVMGSPSADDPVESVAISALALEPPVYPPNRSGPRHIFAFGTSGTWGVNQTPSSSWKVSNLHEGGLFGGAFGDAMAEEDRRDSTSFLNIPPSNSWGSPTFEGLSTNNEGSQTTAGD